jgi:hypothetical protein
MDADHTAVLRRIQAAADPSLYVDGVRVIVTIGNACWLDPTVERVPESKFNDLLDGGFIRRSLSERSRYLLTDKARDAIR